MIRYWNGIFFAMLWTLGMVLWAWPVAPAQALILTVGGALAGAAFHFMLQWWVRHQSRP